MMGNIEDIYTNIIMEHSMNSQNHHELEGETCSAHGHNPNCGDDITLHIKLQENVLQDLSFTGSGCAISQSSVSIMADVLRGKTIDEAKDIVDIFCKMIDRVEITEQEKQKLVDAIAFQNIANMPARVKCALLGWKTLKSKLDEIS